MRLTRSIGYNQDKIRDRHNIASKVNSSNMVNGFTIPQNTLAPSETTMWAKESRKNPNERKYSESEINDKYAKGERRILTEINREKLSSLVEAIDKPGYLDIQPLYQRRKRWDNDKKSRLIESLLINIPILPIILYEIKYNSYEVIDGQQRLTAIHEFYRDKFSLSGLESWTELNGLKYSELPHIIKDGIDRRSLSTIILIHESTEDPEEAAILKQIAFERINTGGVKLSKQEVRNCLLSGDFNNLLFKLSRNSIFSKAWGIPIDDEDSSLLSNNLYKKMEDVELILRFFALRHASHFKNGNIDFLDEYMRKSNSFTTEDLEFLEHVFNQTIKLAHAIFEDKLFKPFNPEKREWSNRAYKEYYDAVMVGCSYHLDKADTLVKRKELVISKTQDLLSHKNDYNLFTGKGGTKAGLLKRIELFSQMLESVHRNQE